MVEAPQNPLGGRDRPHVVRSREPQQADYLQRSARHIASETDVEQAYAVGRAGVEFAIAGTSAVMPAIRRLSDAPYHWDIPSGLISWRFDHLVGERYQHRRQVEAERLGGLEIDDELELRWLLDWNISRLLAFQDLSTRFGRAPISAGAIPAHL